MSKNYLKNSGSGAIIKGMKNTLTVTKIYGESYDCDDCGPCHPESICVEYNNLVVWEKYSDGHYSGSQSEQSILECIVSKWLQDNKENLILEFTEEKRLQWNLDAPGNRIAHTPEAWESYHQSQQRYLLETAEHIKKRCEHLPESEILQVKMIGLWMESEMDMEIKVVAKEISE